MCAADHAHSAREPGFEPTHVVPPDGMSAWETPDDSRPTDVLDPLLPVRLADRRGDWGRIVCANGWSAWVDGRLLVSVPQAPPATGRPLTRTADQRPQLAKVAEAVGRYRSAVDDLAEGRIDRETFRRRTRGVRVGVVVDGESVWLYEAEHERWVYGDGSRLSTFAVSAPPAGEHAHGPTRDREPTDEQDSWDEQESWEERQSWEERRSSDDDDSDDHEHEHEHDHRHHHDRGSDDWSSDDEGSPAGDEPTRPWRPDSDGHPPTRVGGEP
ncbi:hypothetical protein [Streptomyces sp. NPDC048057]|uniref:hypothetical protein n=1 Tax=Streptomyces sp. NPDC048057 TaxID=3155628 RepID=UPI0033CF0835